MLNVLFKNANIYFDGSIQKADLLVENGRVVSIGIGIVPKDDLCVIDVNNFYIFPGFADVHVHLREPGFFYKESINTGTAAAAKGGFTLVCSMPNLDPVPDCRKNLQAQQDIINSDAVIKVLPYAAITVGQKGKELVNFEDLRNDCFAFSDDGKGVQSQEQMLLAMERAQKSGKAIVAHCEDESLLDGGYIHEGEYAKLHGHKGISSASEYEQVKRDILLAEKTGVQYHVCHISTKETVELVRQAKKRGLAVSCETAPHYLAFNDMDLQENGWFKMNPPIRSKGDQQALIEGILDNTIEIIATDHAPHSQEEKSRGLEKSNMGVVGLETSFGAINTYLVKTGLIDYCQLVQLMSINPRKIFGLPFGIALGEIADFVLVDTESEWLVTGENFVSKGKFTPFEGKKLTGEILATVYNGKVVYNNSKFDF